MSEPALEVAHTLLPWQQEQWQGLQARLHAGRLPHALLLTGKPGLGKRRFAEAFVQSLLCQQPLPDGQACASCRTCLLYAAGTHPDYLTIQPAEEGKAILIDQIRDITAYIALKGHYGNHRAVIICPADRMNAAAANCLLKALEEPTPGCLLLLITSNPGALLATVRSRCQLMPFSAPAADTAIQWLAPQLNDSADPAVLLAMADGAPLAALAMFEQGFPAQRAALLEDFTRLLQRKASPTSLAAAWLESGAGVALQAVLSWTTDMIRLRSTPQPAYLANPDIKSRLTPLAQQFKLPVLYTRYDHAARALGLLNRQANVQLLLEDVLISWQ